MVNLPQRHRNDEYKARGVKTDFPAIYNLVKARARIKLKLKDLSIKFEYNNLTRRVYCNLKIRGLGARQLCPFSITDSFEIADGRQGYNRFITVEQKKELYDEMLKIESDPIGYFTDYGRKTGICAICGRTLTNDHTPDPRDGRTSVQRGVGPVCAEYIGLFPPAPEPLQFDLEGLLDEIGED